MKRRIITLIAMAIVLCLACLMMVSCDETVKDSGGGVILEPSQDDASTDTPTPVQKKYTLTVNNGKGISNYTYNDSESVTVVADETTKAFLYWEFEGVEVTKEPTFTFSIKNDVTLTAVYTEKFFFYLDAGEGVIDTSTFTVLYGQNYTLPVPTLNNYYFLGWYYSGRAYTDNQGASTSKFYDEENIFLKARYQEKPLFKISVTNGDGDALVISDHYYHLDEEVEISALAVEDRQNKGWVDEEGEVITTDSSYSFVVSGELTLIAKYVEAYRIDVTGGSGQGVYEKNTVINISFSIAPSGKEFLGWKIDGEEDLFTTERSFQHTVTGRIKFVAVMEIKKYSITYKVEGEEDYVEYYSYNETIIVREEPTKEHYTFSSWTGLPSTMKMPARDIEVVGVFIIDKHQITVINGSGTNSYGWNSVATLIANEPTGMEFLRWVDTATGSEVSVDNPYSFNVLAPASLTAEFTKIDYTLRYEITVIGEDLHNLISYQTGEPKSVGGVYASFVLNYGDNTISLTDSISCQHYLPFSGWSDVPATMPAHDVTITGNFTIMKHTITVYDALTNEQVTNEYDYNQEISISVEVPIGYEFNCWKVGTDDIVSYDNPYVFRVMGNRAYTGYIDMAVYHVNYYVKAVYEEEFVFYQTQDYFYNANITRLGSPQRANHYFGNWSQTPATMPAYDITVEGIFYYNTHTVNVIAGKIIKRNGQDITPVNSGVFDYNDQITINADIDTGKYFEKWMSEGRTVSLTEEYTFTLEKNISFTANFGDKLYNVVYVLDGDYEEPIYHHMYKYDDSIALPDDPIQEHYHFSGWTLEGGGDIPSRMPDNDLVCVGEFIIDQHEVTIEYGYIVAVDGLPLDTPLTGGPYLYDYGTEFTLHATLPVGKWFKKWITQFPNENYNVVETPYADYNGEYVYTLSKDIYLSAVFEASRHVLTVNDDGRISGYEVKSIEVEYNTSVTVMNVGNLPGRRYVEIRQDGVFVTEDADYTFNLQYDTEITVVYEYIPYEVKYVLNGAIYDNYVYSSEYYIYTDEIETLPSPPAIEHYSFGGWQLMGYVEFPSVIRNIVTNIIINGSYIIDKHTVNLTSGKIVKVDGEDIPPVSEGTFDYNTQLSVVADDIIGQYFVSWINDVGQNTISLESAVVFNLEQDTSYSATYDYYDYEVKYYIIGAIYSELTPYLNGEQYLYHYADTIEYLSHPSVIENYVFIGWYDAEELPLPETMPDTEGRILNAYGRYEHIYSYTLNAEETGYTVSRSPSVAVEIYPSEITLPTEYESKAVFAVAPSGFEDITNLTSVSIGDNILEIGQGAFSGCDSLLSLQIPFIGKKIDASGNDDKLVYIFGSVVPTTLKTVTITSDTSVGSYAFAELNNIEEIVLPSTVESLGSYAFYNCTLLSCINLLDGLISIGEFAFGLCISLTVIDIPTTLTSIGNDAFSGCSGVERINYNAILLSNLDTFNYVFRLYADQVDIVIGSSVVAIPDYLFFPGYDGGMTVSLLAASATVEFLSDNGNFSLTSIGESAFVSLPISTISLPSTVTEIGGNAFVRTHLTSIDIGSNITEIGMYAFANMTNINVNYQAQFISPIDDSMRIFNNTTGTLSIGNNVTQIPDYLFSYANFSSVVFAEDSLCSSIGSYAFANNTSLVSVQIPSSVNAIGDYAFASATKLNNIYFDAEQADSLTSSSEVFFDSGTEGEGITLNIGSSVVAIPDYLFYSDLHSANITNIAIDEGGQCNSIGRFAFYKLINLVSVEQFEFVKTIGESAFENCTALNEYVISAATRYIESKAFANCSAISLKCEVYEALKAWSADWKDETAVVQYNYNTVLSGDYRYSVHGGMAYLTKYEGVDTALTAPSVIDTYTVRCVGNTYEGNETIVSVDMPMGIQEICDYAFNGCTSLSSVTYLDSLVYLGQYAFNNCGALSTFAIPNSITEILEGSFNNCSSLISVEGNELDLSGIASIGEKAFYGCSSIEKITLSNIITEIKAKTFAYCTSLNGISIPDSVVSIATDAFLGCLALSYYEAGELNSSYSTVDGVLFNKIGSELIAYPAGDLRDTYEITFFVDTIAPYAFSNAANLLNLTIPNTIGLIGERAFEYCVNLQTITYNAVDAETDGLCLFASVGSAGSGVSVSFGNNVTNIPDNLFNDENAKVTQIIFGTSLVSIGQGAFYGAQITALTLPESLVSIGNNAFKETGALETINYNPIALNNLLENNGVFANAGTSGLGITVNIGANVLSMPDYIFSSGVDYQINIIAINYLGDSLESIGKYAFYEAPLSEITITENVTAIGEKAFADNTLVSQLNYNAIMLNNSIATDNVFQNLGSALGEGNYASVTIGENVKNIPDYFNYNIAKVNLVTINSTVLLRVGQSAFKGTLITGISLPDSVTEVAASAFESLQFTALTLPDSLETIGSSAFRGMNQIAALTLPSGLLTIGSSAFENWSALTSISVPQSVTRIGQNAFGNATSLASINYNATNIADMYAGKAFNGSGSELSPVTVNIGAAVERIPNYLFEGCAYIQSVVFSGNNVCTTIGERAFYMLEDFSSIVDLPASVVTVGASAFEGCISLAAISLTANAGNLIINASAFSGCVALEEVILATSNSSLFGIGDYAFYNCTSLLTIDFGTGSVLEYIGNYAFNNCSVLDLSLPASLKNTITAGNPSGGIGYYAFENCIALAAITIPTGVTFVYEGTFKNCTSLTTAVIHSDIVYIGESAFEGCTSLLELTVPEKIEHLGDKAFYNCTGATNLNYYPTASGLEINETIANQIFGNLGTIGLGTNVVIGANVKFIPAHLFYGTALSSPKITGIAFETSAGMSSVAEIGEKAFYYANNITSLVLPEGLITIQEQAFAYCLALEQLTIPSSVTLMKYRAFAFLGKLTDLYYNPTACADFENEILEVNKTEVFLGIGNYQDEFYTNEGILLTIGNSVVSLPENMFYHMENRAKVKEIALELNTTLTTISSNAFYMQEGLTTMSNITDTITYIGESAFEGCTSFVSSDVMRHATTVNNEAFLNCSSLPSLYMAEELITLGNTGVYMNCTGVEEVFVYTYNIPQAPFVSFNTIFKGVGIANGFALNIASDVTSIPDHFMHNFENFGTDGEIQEWTLNISELNIANPGIIIGDYAFSGVGKLTDITLGITELDDVTYLGDYAFYRCPDLVNVTLGNVEMNKPEESITSTHIFAYSSVVKLETVNKLHISEIGRYAFYHCENLNVINPNHDIEYKEHVGWGYCDNQINTIGEYAFAYSGVTDVYLSAYISAIGAHAFEGCLSLTIFRWPDNVTDIGDYAFYNCENLEFTTTLSSDMIDEGTYMTNYATLYADGGTGTIIGKATDTLTIGSTPGMRTTPITAIGAYVFYNTKLNITISIDNDLVDVDANAFSGMLGTLSGEAYLP